MKERILHRVLPFTLVLTILVFLLPAAALADITTSPPLAEKNIFFATDKSQASQVDISVEVEQAVQEQIQGKGTAVY